MPKTINLGCGFRPPNPLQKTSNLNIKPSSDENWKKKDEKAVAPKKTKQKRKKKKKINSPTPQTMISAAFAHQRILNELSSSHTPYKMDVGYLRDCSRLKRLHAARALDRVRVASDLQKYFVVSSSSHEQADRKLDDELFDSLMDIDSDSDGNNSDDSDESSNSESSDDDAFYEEIDELLRESENSEDRLGDFLLQRATAALSRRQPMQAGPVMTKFDNTISRYTDLQCHDYFHLPKQEIEKLFIALDVPEIFITDGSKSRWTGEAAFLMYLRRTCRVIKYSDVKIQEEMGGRQVSAMCEVVRKFQSWMFTEYSDLVSGESMTRWVSLFFLFSFF